MTTAAQAGLMQLKLGRGSGAMRQGGARQWSHETGGGEAVEP